MFNSNQSFSIHCPQEEGCLHCLMWSLYPQILGCYLYPVCHSMMMFGSLHRDMGMGIVHVVRHVHEHIMFYWGFPTYPNVHPQGALFENPPPCPLLLLLG